MAGTPAAEANQTRSGILPGDCFTGLAHVVVVWVVTAAGNSRQASCADVDNTAIFASRRGLPYYVG